RRAHGQELRLGVLRPRPGVRADLSESSPHRSPRRGLRPAMTDTRNTRADVVQAAGRLFAERGYHGTSMRDLGRELGLQGSSLYSHIRSKEDLLVDVVQRAADLFESSAARAQTPAGDEKAKLRALIAGHVDVLLDHV